jgi:hypothetical protein
MMNAQPPPVNMDSRRQFSDLTHGRVLHASGFANGNAKTCRPERSIATPGIRRIFFLEGLSPLAFSSIGLQ